MGKKITQTPEGKKKAEEEVVKLLLLKKNSKDRVSIGAEKTIEVITDSKVNPCNEAEEKAG